jgi:hypothetical protein
MFLALTQSALQVVPISIVHVVSLRLIGFTLPTDGGITASGVPTTAAVTSVCAIYRVRAIIPISLLVGADELGHHPGIYGINNMNLTINFLPNCKSCVAVSQISNRFNHPTDPTFFGKTATLGSSQ